jgi:competence protein ComEC
VPRSSLGFPLLALLAGTLLGDAHPALSSAALPLGLLSLAAGLLVRRRARCAVWLFVTASFAAGLALPARWTGPPPPADLTRVLGQADPRCAAPAEVLLTGVLDAAPLPWAGGTRLELDVEEIARGGRRARATGRVRIQVREEAHDLHEGDRLLARVVLRPPHRYGNVGCADTTRSLARIGIRRVAAVKSVRALVPLPSPRRSSPFLENTRRCLARFLERRAPGEAGVLEALLLGEKGRISPAVRDAYARAGVAHVLAVSGLHVAIVTLGVAVVLGGALGRVPRLASGGAARGAALAGGTLAGWCYALLTGGHDPGLRAAAMATTIAAAALVRRRGDAWSALLLSAFVLVLSDPARVFQLSTRLSFVSVAGLLWAWPGLRAQLLGGTEGSSPARRALVRAILWIRASMAATLAATLATLPLQAGAFGQVSLVAPIANLIVVPLLGSFAVPCLLLAGTILPWSAPAAGLLVDAAALAVRLSTACAVRLAALRWSILPVPPPTALEWIAWAGLAAALPPSLPSHPAGPAGKRLARVAFAVCLAALVLGELHARAQWSSPPALRANFLDVGQGDAALFETPGGKHFLVDAGPAFTLPGGWRMDAGLAAVAPTLRARRIRRIDLLAISHPDLDHSGGALAILDHFDVGEVWFPAGTERLPPIVAIRDRAARLGVPARVVARGTPAGTWGKTRVEILWPPPSSAKEEGAPLGSNDASLVLRIVSPGLSVLLPGDIEATGERRLLMSGADVRADLLKVPHHGSGTSTTAAFLQAVAPRAAVISAGRWNRFGFPARGALARLAERGVRVYRTDRDGAISATIETDPARVGERHDSRGLPDLLKIRTESDEEDQEVPACPGGAAWERPPGELGHPPMEPRGP